MIWSSRKLALERKHGFKEEEVEYPIHSGEKDYVQLRVVFTVCKQSGIASQRGEEASHIVSTVMVEGHRNYYRNQCGEAGDQYMFHGAQNPDADCQ